MAGVFLRESGREAGMTAEGGGVAAAATVGVTGWTMRLLTTVLMPLTCAASAEASERAASLLTVPLSVAIRFWTEDWMGSVLSAVSVVRRVWRAAVMDASSGAGAEVLQPEKLTARASVKTVAAKERLACMEPLFRVLNMDLSAYYLMLEVRLVMQRMRDVLSSKVIDEVIIEG